MLRLSDFKMELRDIFEFNDPESQEELRKIYGPTPQCWEDVENWDDIVPMELKALVSELEEDCLGKETCPHLKKLDGYFYYCEKRARGLKKMGHPMTDKPVFGSAQYDAHVDHFILQLYCMCPEERFQKCTNFKSPDI